MEKEADGFKKNWNIGFLVYPNFTALDLVGPYEVLSRAFDKCILISEQDDIVSSNTGLKMVADRDFSDCPLLDVLVVPGGPGQTPAMDNPALIEFIRSRYNEVKYLAAVCTGTLLVAQAGLLENKKATTHWLAQYELPKFKCTYSTDRVVWNGNIITGAGVSAGIDLALHLVEKIFSTEEAQRIQLAIEYDPQPPYDCGSPEKAPQKLVQKLKSTSRFHQK